MTTRILCLTCFIVGLLIGYSKRKAQPARKVYDIEDVQRMRTRANDLKRERKLAS